MVRAAFGTNNVDTCARVCHSPTGYGLKTTFGTSAGTQDFASVEEADVIMVIGANPTDGHPVFASRMKRRLRQGAKLIVVDPRRIDLVRSPHVEASHHLQLLPGTNVAVINAMAHVVVTEGLMDQAFVDERCEDVGDWAEFIARPENSPEAMEPITGVPAAELRAAARLYATAPNAAIYYGLGVTEHSQGSTMVMGMANLAMATGNIGREGVGVSPLRGQNNVQGSCDMGSFPHELSGYRHISDDTVRDLFADLWGTTLQPEPGLRIPNMLSSAIDGTFRGIYIQGEDIAQSDPNTQHVKAALLAMELVVVQDLFLNETAKFAHVFLPGTSFLEKNGTFTNAERRINRVRPVMAAKTGKQEWQVVCEIAAAMGYDMAYADESEIMDEIAALTPDLRGRVVQEARRAGQHPVAVQRLGPGGDPDDARRCVRPGQGPFRADPVRADRGALEPQVPVAAHHRPDPDPVQRRRADASNEEQPVASRGRPRDPSERCRDARHRGRHLGLTGQSRRRDHAAGAIVRADAARRRLHDLPPPGDRRQRRDHRVLGLGDRMPRIQGDGRPGDARADDEAADHARGARSSPRSSRPVPPAREPTPGVSEHGLAQDLVRMSNQISRQFGYLSDDQAAAKVADHIHRFWEPRMLVAFEAHVASQPGDFEPIVLAAARILAERYGEATAAH